MTQDFKLPILSISLKNLLSFNDKGVLLKLDNLNIVIGPNGSGKSNFLDVLRFWKTLSRSGKTPLDFFKEEGGIKSWIHQDNPNGTLMEINITSPQILNLNHRRKPIEHSLGFVAEEDPNTSAHSFEIKSEIIECTEGEEEGQKPYLYYRFYANSGTKAIINTYHFGSTKTSAERGLAPETIDRHRSILLQKTDEELYPELCALAKLYERIKIYQSWEMGRTSKIKKAQDLFQVADYLNEDYSNLVVIVEKIKNEPKIRKMIDEKMKKILPRFRLFDIERYDGTGRIYFVEGDDLKVPSSRISDGTFRFFVLLVLLFAPSNQGQLICIEEPEIGLHPEVLPVLVEALREASKNRQIIITTHSITLLDYFDPTQESIIVFENKEGFTTAEKLNEDDLKRWLSDDYSLGVLWAQGKLGGNP